MISYRQTVDPVLLTSSEDIAGAPVELRDEKTALMVLKFLFCLYFYYLGDQKPCRLKKIRMGKH